LGNPFVLKARAHDRGLKIKKFPNRYLCMAELQLNHNKTEYIQTSIKIEDETIY
jgi:hypothetical protein